MPTTTALQLNDDGLLGRDLDQGGDLPGQDGSAVVVEGARVVDRGGFGQGAEAGIEVVEPGVDQFQRQHRHAEPLADPVVAPGVGAEAVAGEEGLAAEEGVAGPLEIVSRAAGSRP